MNFNFLNTITAIELPKEEKQTSGRVAQPKNPESGLKLRIFKDGSVYPSRQLVDKFNLEYEHKNFNNPHVEVSNGFDIIDSTEWVQFPKVDGDGNPIDAFLMIAAVSKDEPKVDLFGQVRYNEQGEPINSVMDQGSKREELVEKLKNVYGVDFDETRFVDLEINTEVTIFANLPQFILPKKMVKGTRAGEITYEIRTGISVHPLVISTLPEQEELVNNQVETINN